MGEVDEHRRRRSLADTVRACAAAVDAPLRRSPAEIRTAVQASGLALEDAGAAFWRSLRVDWLDGSQDTRPFDAAGANDEYLFLALHRGLLARCLACPRPARNGTAFCSGECVALWGQSARAHFTDPPVSMPVDDWNALLTILGGSAPPAAALARLRRFLEGRP